MACSKKNSHIPFKGTLNFQQLFYPCKNCRLSHHPSKFEAPLEEIPSSLMAPVAIPMLQMKTLLKFKGKKKTLWKFQGEQQQPVENLGSFMSWGGNEY